MVLDPTKYGRLIDRECVICGKQVGSNHPRQMTCSVECRSALRSRRRKQYRIDALPVVPNFEAKRTCESCRSVLSAYNRGRYCHSCWAAFSPKQRQRRGGDR